MKEALPIDYRLLTDTLIEFNIARRNVAIYPRGHPSVETTLKRAYEYLQKLFSLRHTITIAIVKDAIVVDNNYLDRKNPVLKEIALNLSDQDVASISFVEGVSMEELYRFLMLISDREQALKEALQRESLPHIKVEFIDYSVFVFSDAPTSQGRDSPPLLEKYIYALMSGRLSEAVWDIDMTGYSPAVVASLINSLATKDTDQSAYDRVISSYLRRTRQEGFTGHQLKKLTEMINSLKPELKKQFLTSTLRYATEHRDAMRRALQDISVEDIMDMLRLLNEEGVTIPDSLRNLIGEFVKISSDTLNLQDLTEGGLIDDIIMSKELREILHKGNFGTYVPEQYQEEINRILSTELKSRPQINTEVLNEVSEDVLRKRHFKIVLRLIESDIVTPEEMELLFERLYEYIDDFIKQGSYEELIELVQRLRELVQKEDGAETIREALDRFTSREFLDRVAESFRHLPRDYRQNADAVVQYFGEEILPSLFDMLTEESSGSTRRFLLNLIISRGQEAVKEAIKRLNDERWFVKRNMLYILNECGSEEVLIHARSYCNHEHPKVRMEALKCLLKFKDPYAVETLRGFINSDNEDLFMQAVSLAATFRLKELLPELIKVLRKRAITGVDYQRKIPVIRALGEIGGKEVLDAFRDVLSQKSLLHRGVIETMKEEVYKALKNFPYEQVRDMIETGLKSRNEEIRRQCMMLKKAAHMSDR